MTLNSTRSVLVSMCAHSLATFVTCSVRHVCLTDCYYTRWIQGCKGERRGKVRVEDEDDSVCTHRWVSWAETSGNWGIFIHSGG